MHNEEMTARTDLPHKCGIEKSVGFPARSGMNPSNRAVALLHDAINKDTRLCMSLAGRPGNFGTRFHNYLYAELGLNFIYKAFTTADLEGAIIGVRALGIRGCAISMPFKEACIEFVRRTRSLGRRNPVGQHHRQR